MPTPSPIIETSSGVIVLTSVSPARMKRSRNAVATAVMRERDRDRRRDERAEDDEQHDERREQPEQLLRSLLDRRELRVAVELHGHAGGLDRLADRLLDGNDRRAILLVDHPVELGLRVRDAPVVGGRVVGERRLDALEAGLVLRRLELGRLRGARSLRRSPASARACRAARRRGQRRRRSARRPAPPRTRPRSDRSLSAYPSPGSRTRHGASRRTRRRWTTSTAKMPSHAPMTRHGCVAHRRAQRDSVPVESRSCAARRSVPSVISRPLVVSFSE